MIIELHRRQTGTPPKTLDALVPTYTKSLPLDPFTGKPLLYQLDPQSYTVYSVGENRTDDKGQIEADQGPTPPDEGIRIRLTPAP